MVSPAKVIKTAAPAAVQHPGYAHLKSEQLPVICLA